MILDQEHLIQDILMIIIGVGLIFVFLMRIVTQIMALYFICIKKNKCLQSLGVDRILLFTSIFSPIENLKNMKFSEDYNNIEGFVKLLTFFRIYSICATFLFFCFTAMYVLRASLI